MNTPRPRLSNDPAAAVPMVKVVAHGRLKRLVPRPLRLSVGSPAEAVRALCALLPGARDMLAGGAWRITAGSVTDAASATDAEPVSLDTLGLGLGGCDELHIHPHAAAAGTDACALEGPSLLGAAWSLTCIPRLGGCAGYEAASGGPEATAGATRVPVIYGGPVRVRATELWRGTAPERVQLTEAPPGDGTAPTFVQGDVRLRTRATLRAVDLLGEGPMAGLVDGLKSVFIDGVPVQNADGTLNVEGIHVASWHPGTETQPPPAGVAETAEAQTFAPETVTHAAPVTGTVQTACDAVRVTLGFERLETLTEEGDGLGASVEFRIDVKGAGGAYATAVGPQSISDRSVGPVERAWRVPLPEGAAAPYTIRVTRETPDATADRVHDTLQWVGLEAIAGTGPAYPHSAVLLIEAEAEKFAGAHTREYEVCGRIVDVPSNYDPVTRQYTGLWDGTFKPEWTDNGAWCVFDMLRSTRYGLGRELDPARVEAAKWALYSIARFNDEMVEDGTEASDGTPNMEPRYRFSGAVAAEADAARVIAGMLSNFRAGFYGADGALEAVQDAHKVFPASDEEPVARAPVALLGPANVVDGAFEYAAVQPHRGRASAVAVSFTDPARGGRTGIEPVVDEALVARHGYRRTGVAALYCTSRAQAHRLGRHLLQEQELEPSTVRYRAGLDQDAVRPGDLVRIADPAVTGKGTAGRILSVISTDTDTIRILATEEPDRPAGGENDEAHLPAGWTREPLEPTVPGTVYAVERRREFLNGTLHEAAPWGAVTVEAPRIGYQDIPLTNYETHRWRAAERVDPAFIAGGATAYFRHLRLRSDGVDPSFQLSATATGAPDAPGPELTDEMERGERVLAVIAPNGDMLWYNGPAHPDNEHVDDSEPYWWTTVDRSTVGAWVQDHNLQNRNVTVRLRLP